MSSILDKLKERQDKLKAQIKTAKAKETKKQATMQNNRARIIGLAISAEMEENKDLSILVNTALDARVTIPKERKILGLAQLPTD